MNTEQPIASTSAAQFDHYASAIAPNDSTESISHAMQPNGASTPPTSAQTSLNGLPNGKAQYSQDDVDAEFARSSHLVSLVCLYIYVAGSCILLQYTNGFLGASFADVRLDARIGGSKQPSSCAMLVGS